MAFGPTIESRYQDGMIITLGDGTPADLEPLFPVPEALRQFSINRWRGYMEQPTPDAYYEGVLAAEGVTNWMVRTNTSQATVGTAGVGRDGWFYTNILDPEQQGKQIGTRTSRLVIAASFLGEPSLQEIVTFTRKTNTAGLRVTEKINVTEDVKYADDPAVTQRRFIIPRPLASTGGDFFAMLQAVGEQDSIEAFIH